MQSPQPCLPVLDYDGVGLRLSPLKLTATPRYEVWILKPDVSLNYKFLK